jgi:hypothetical protein
MKTILIFFAIIFLSSCRSLDERNEECIENMPSEVRGYVRDFLYEGEKRGKKIKLGRLRVFLSSEYLTAKSGNRAAAQTNTILKTITIDISSTKWKKHPKALVFHELGHAVLRLDHSEHKEDLMYKVGSSDLSETALNRLFN